MKIIDINKQEYTGKSIVGLGNFDGFHLGHQALLKSVIRLSKEKNLEAAMLFFKTNTKSFFGKEKNLLTTLHDKLQLAESMGIDIAFVVDFDKQFAAMSPEKFISAFICQKMKADTVVVGKNFSFGFAASGNVRTLSEHENKYNYHTHIIEDVFYKGELISSTRIRKALLEGDIATASACLGRPYKMQGTVIRGQQRGSKMGFPTANLDIEDSYLIPMPGVYVTVASVLGKKYLAMTSIGNNPTFEGDRITIESNLLHFDKMIYNEIIQLSFHQFIRKNIKFQSIDQLITQLNKDRESTEKYGELLVQQDKSVI